MDPNNPTSHCLVAVNVLACAENTFDTIKKVLSCFQHEWSSHLSFPPHIVQNPEMLTLLKSIASSSKDDNLKNTACKTSEEIDIDDKTLKDHSPKTSAVGSSGGAVDANVATSSSSNADGKNVDEEMDVANDVLNTSFRRKRKRPSFFDENDDEEKKTTQHAETTVSPTDLSTLLDEPPLPTNAVVPSTSPLLPNDLASSSIEEKISHHDDDDDDDEDIFTQTDLILKNIHRQLNSINPRQNNIASISTPVSRTPRSDCTPIVATTASNNPQGNTRTVTTPKIQLNNLLSSSPPGLATTVTSIQSISTTSMTEITTASPSTTQNKTTTTTSVISTTSPSSVITTTPLLDTTSTSILNSLAIEFPQNRFPGIWPPAPPPPPPPRTTPAASKPGTEIKKEPGSSLESLVERGLEDLLAGGSSASQSSSSYTTNVDGQRTNISDLPEALRLRLAGIERAETAPVVTSNNRRVGRNTAEDDGLPSLMTEGGTGGICSFLLGRTAGPSNSQLAVDAANNGIEEPVDEDDDDELNFAANFIEKRRQKRNVNNLLSDDAVEEEATAAGDEVTLKPEPDLDLTAVAAAAAAGGEDVLVVIKDELDDIFDCMSEFTKDVEAEACAAIKSNLLPHQKKALNFMMLKENTDELPPFWECITEGRDYFNLGTRRRIGDIPKGPNGGILADDMGLGKTLVTISLILTNHKDGKSLKQHKNILPRDPSDIGISDDTKFRKKGGKSPTMTDFKRPGFQFRQIFLEKLTKDKKKKKKKRKKEGDDSMFSDDDEDVKPKNLAKHVDTIVNTATPTPATPTTSG